MGYWAPYVPVAKRRAQAAKHLKEAHAKGKTLNPIKAVGRQIANTFWGKAWCDHLENYSDYENRLPRGRTYVRNGSVIDLQVSKGTVLAQVMGSYLYHITIEIKAMSVLKWQTLVKACAGKIDSLVELLQGKFSQGVMSKIVDKDSGLFPSPSEISMECTCPDSAGLCKHIAAVLYGIGACLDTKPEWFFTLRHVDHLELVASASVGRMIAASKPSADALDDDKLSDLFGIEMAPAAEIPAVKKATRSLPKVVQAKANLVDERIDLTLAQAASLLKISEPRLARLLDDKMIPFHRVGKQRRIAFEEIVKYRKHRGKS